jgi:S-adenosylhomocysteine hydrolase
LLEAQQEIFRTCQYLDNCVRGKFLIIGATGETSIGRNELLSMEHNVILVSSSSDQREIGLNELKALSSGHEQLLANGDKSGTKFIIRGTEKSINLIADGYPINFWAEESMPNRVSDVIMSLIYISSIDISLNSNSLDKKVLTDRVNELERQYKLAELYMRHS